MLVILDVFAESKYVEKTPYSREVVIPAPLSRHPLGMEMIILADIKSTQVQCKVIRI